MLLLANNVSGPMTVTLFSGFILIFSALFLSSPARCRWEWIRDIRPGGGPPLRVEEHSGDTPRAPEDQGAGRGFRDPPGPLIRQGSGSGSGTRI